MFFLIGCIGGGMHGSIKYYQFNGTKQELEETVHGIISSGGDFYRDTLRDWHDTTSLAYHNDGKTYLTFFIQENTASFRYTIRFRGESSVWDTARNSGIFIAYAFDSLGTGGSNGNGGFKKLSNKSRKRILEIFERKFVTAVGKHFPLLRSGED